MTLASDHILVPHPFIPSPQEPHPMSVPFTLQQAQVLPVPFIPLTTPCYPIPRRTTPFIYLFFIYLLKLIRRILHSSILE